MQKCTWLLLRPTDVDAETFADVVRDVGKAARDLIATANEIHVTPQEPGQIGSTVDLADGEHTIDAVIEVTTAESYVPLDPFTEELRRVSGYVAGWRSHPTLIYDVRTQPATGEPFELPSVFVFVERLDGTTPEFFSRNWYVHAGHTDGEEAENDDARARRAERERTPGGYYMQHRFLEPIAATPWVAHGYTKLAMPAFVPAEGLAPGVREQRRHPGEEPFDRWPARIVQGRTYALP